MDETRQIRVDRDWITPALITVGVILIVSGVAFATINRKKTVAALPEYRPSAASSSPSGISSPLIFSPTDLPPTLPNLESLPSPVQTSTNPVPTPIRLPVAPTVITQIPRPVTAPVNSGSTSLPEYRATEESGLSTVLADYQPQFISPPSVVATVSARLVVPGASYSLTIDQGKTVSELMKTATSSGFRYETKHFSDLGDLVVAINGQAQAGSQFWTYTVNGTFASQGISSQIVNNGDVISWNLSSG